MTDYSLELFRSNLPGIAQIYFMVHPPVCNIEDIALFFYKAMH